MEVRGSERRFRLVVELLMECPPLPWSSEENTVACAARKMQLLVRQRRCSCLRDKDGIGKWQELEKKEAPKLFDIMFPSAVFGKFQK